MTWLKPKKVLVPCDFSANSFEAIQKGLEMAAEGSEVHVLHIMRDFHPVDPSVLLVDYNEDEFKAKVFNSMKTQLHDRGVDPDSVKLHVEIGDPGTMIADVAKQLGIELILIPSHGRTGITRMLLGSVAERVVRLAACPVLIIKSPKD